jgi:hypothetical protein
MARSGHTIRVWLFSTAKIAGEVHQLDDVEDAKEDTPWFVRGCPPIRT